MDSKKDRQGDEMQRWVIDLFVDRQMEAGKKYSKGLDEGKANSEKHSGRIVELGKANQTDGMRLCRASESSAHRGNMMQPQSVS